MVARVHDGGATAMGAMLFGMSSLHNPNDALIVADVVRPTVLSNTSEFFNVSTNYINSIYQDEEVINIGKKVIQDFGSALNKFVMTNITNYNITEANDMMKMVISSNPNVIKLNHLGVLEGYTSTVVDLDLYRYIDSGNVTFTEDSINYNTYNSSSYDEYTEDDKLTIMDCWMTVNKLLAEGIDPTSSDLSRY